MKLSATRIKQYLTCPRQYRYVYVERLPVTLTPQLVFGKAIHQVLQQLHIWYLENDALPGQDEAFTQFMELWREALRVGQPIFTEKSGTPEQFETIAGPIIGNFLRRYGSLPPLAVEFAFELEWRDHVLCGIIDRIEVADTGLVVVDFKTGKAKPTIASLNNDLQLTIYAYAVEQVFSVPVERVVFHHLRSDAEMPTTRDAGDFRHLLEAVLPSVVSGIEAGMFPPSYGFHCNWCDFRERCQQESMAEPSEIHVAWPEVLPDPSLLITA